MRLIELGFECNNACTFCAQGKLRTSSRRAPIAEILAAIAAVPAGEPIALQGGEPTLRDDLCEIIRAARERSPSVLLQTNARRLGGSEYAQKLAEAGLSALDVSLHGCSEAMHDYHTGVAGSFRQSVLGLGRARAAQLPFGITTVVTRSNFRHLAEITHVAHALGARAVHFAALRPFGSALANAPRLGAPPALVAPHAQRAFEMASRLGLQWLAGARASNAAVRDWFAGLGTAEQPESSFNVAALHQVGAA